MGQWIKNPPAMQEMWIQSLSGEGLLKEGMSTLVQYPVFLAGELHRERSLVDYSPWDHKESDMTKPLTLYIV